MLQTRVDDIQGSMEKHPMQPAGVDKGSLEEAKIIEGSVFEASRKNKSNGTVNPRGIAHIFGLETADPVEIARGGQVYNVNVEVLEDRFGSHNQNTDGKNPKTNGTIIPALNATVNSSLGSTYDP